ncbi:MAG: heme exporter protein CcmD [Gammaproteobacteria bacterium]
MDGYTGYLLVAYGVTAAVVVGNLVAARLQFSRTRVRLLEQLARRSGRSPPRAGQVTGKGAGSNETTIGRSS